MALRGSSFKRKLEHGGLCVSNPASAADPAGGIVHPSPDNFIDDPDAKYRAIFDLANDAIFLHDAATGAIVDVNRKMTEMYGYTREQALQLTVADLSAGKAPYTQDGALAHLEAAFAGTPQLFDWLAKDRAGRQFWVQVNLKRVTIGGWDRLLAIVRDVTDRKSAEHEIQARHESQKTLNALLRLALADVGLEELLRRALALVLHSSWLVTRGVGAVYLADEDGALALKAHIGLDAEAAIAVPAERLRECACGPEYHCIPIAAGETRLGVLKVYQDPAHPLEIVEQEFLAAFASTLAGIIIRKHSEQALRAADEQLREQAALVRLGEMAAVVAHEVKNPLAGVRGAIQVIGGRLPPESGDAAVVRHIIARLDALDELMSDLLLFARPPQAHIVPVNIMALARETSELVAQESGARDVRFEVDGTVTSVMADPKLLKSVLLNLLLNATHAIQNTGTVRTSIVAIDRACLVTVTDTGSGIPAEIRDRIFVPFFTTKSRGTGLGLPTAKRLVEAHRGRITVDCPPGGGTIVAIELPQP
jgi:PAS domain S-box-containing protein